MEKIRVHIPTKKELKRRAGHIKEVFCDGPSSNGRLIPLTRTPFFNESNTMIVISSCPRLKKDGFCTNNKEGKKRQCIHPLITRPSGLITTIDSLSRTEDPEKYVTITVNRRI